MRTKQRQKKSTYKPSEMISPQSKVSQSLTSTSRTQPHQKSQCVLKFLSVLTFTVAAAARAHTARSRRGVNTFPVMVVVGGMLLEGRSGGQYDPWLDLRSLYRWPQRPGPAHLPACLHPFTPLPPSPNKPSPLALPSPPTPTPTPAHTNLAYGQQVA